ncbi:MAG: ATP-binding protein [Thermodesulfobacteriota bacterium]|nr:ATP-binding protein [Thermodesulfobacteriota bacterium]
MKIYTKIVITILPLVFFLLFAIVGITCNFSTNAITELAKTWLNTKLSRAMHVITEQENNLKKYDLEKISASISKARIDAGTIISSIEVGREGYIFAVNIRGIITMHPDKGLLGRDVSKEEWFSKIKQGKGQIAYRFGDSRQLAMYDYFKPWQWFVLATDPLEDFYGPASQIKPWFLISGALGSFIMAVVLLFLSRRLTKPLGSLTQGAEQIGRGDLKTRIPVRSNDEFGSLARTFNKMTARLQEITVSRDELEKEIQERIKAEKKILDSERRFQKMLNVIPDMISIQDPDMNIVYSNWHGRGNIPEERRKLHTKCYKTYRGYDDICPDCQVTKVLKTKTQYETETKSSDGTWLDIRAIPLLDENNNVELFVKWVRDITEQKRLEANLHQIQRMKSIGTLAGGIAHNFNNILMGIQGNCSLMKMNKENSHPDLKRLKNIEKSIKDASCLTQQLLGFARGGKYDIMSVDLNQIIEGETRIFEQTRQDITMERKYHQHLHTVEVDEGQIKQVLLNLYINACHAMPNGGKISVHTENIIIDNNYMAPFKVKHGQYVKVSVSDTGIGMDKKTRQRIFEPFFTTKTMTKGTGLGLSSVYGIIKSHGGFINVYSEKDNGTTFKVYLPGSEKQVVQTTTPSPKAVNKAVNDDGAILLVDDEKQIIEVNEELLQELGYKS